MSLMGIDIGTTNCKLGLYSEEGMILDIEKFATPVKKTKNNYQNYDPVKLWENIKNLIENIAGNNSNDRIKAIGISSMAETGLLVDKNTGEPRTGLIPWYDKRTLKQYNLVKEKINSKSVFKKIGIHPSYKYGLSKILWLKEKNENLIKNSVWFSTADYIAFCLTGNFQTDYTLGARTYLFRIDKKEWDRKLMDKFGLEENLFPEVSFSGDIAGYTEEISGIDKGIPVCVSGHDHVCAAFATGAVKPGIVFDSMGTAETLMGTLKARELDDRDYNSGFSYGCQVVKNKYFWMGGISASGGSIEWLRKILDREELTYKEINQLSRKAGTEPGDILYYPYLSGSGAPFPDPENRGAFIGLDSTHSRADLIKAVLEGTSFQLNAMKEQAEEISGNKIRKIITVGGGTYNEYWMRIKASICNCKFEVFAQPEAVLLGAALIAGMGVGIYNNMEEIPLEVSKKERKIYFPEKKYSLIYEKMFNEYMRLQKSLAKYNRRKINRRKK
ncbi:MAG: FGGY-family carbohydrate kinase [Halanaerobiales bacterium]